jgi:hypothetical protein
MDLKPIFPAKEGINQTNYYWFENGFTTQEVDTIVNGSLEYEFQKAVIIDEGNTDKFRKSNIKWLPFDSKWEWVIDKIMSQVTEANNAIWNFELKSMNCFGSISFPNVLEVHLYQLHPRAAKQIAPAKQALT